jgi:ATPase subunit of ABC transporter with duplicated ATPase domains
MAVSITLTNLTFALPDGRALLTNLDLSFSRQKTGLVGRNGVGKSTLVKLIAGELHPQSGSVSVTGSVGVLRQTVQTDADATIGDVFGVREALSVLNRAEQGLASDNDLSVADWTLEARIASSLARMGLTADADTPLANLSGGQQTRACLAALAFSEPDFLLLDEPIISTATDDGL